ncbi:TonB family protein [Methylocella sp. CPCC 101449]|uniref:energy transducer TonB family protein n=1 Tax=Methylocella sp. CPCC 101449 TaxID=2987531 RepID=UPI002890A5D8|nr:TonB family protein [Methylocella sp. CPCC 101449]MDT2019558.1 TonB family protein [Methylocella sp. CPCC 101449]HEV2572251.1 TonB family protein [Beijerinckiaceae bacterium]
MSKGLRELMRPDDDRPGQMLVRWGLAAAAAMAVHGGAVWLALAAQPESSASAEPPPAIMVELAPVAVAPEEEPQDIAPGPQMTEAQPEPVEPETPEPEEEKQEEITPPAPVAEIKPPDLPKNDEAEALIAAPPPKPKPRPRKPPPKVQEVERRRPIHPERPRVRQTTAPPASQAQRAQTAAAPAAGASGASSVSPATWRSSLVAHLNRYKRFPAGAAGAGTVTIAFTINRSGAVVGARLVAGSGDSALDAEAVSLPRRASPVPAPPANMGGGAITLAVPIRFNR